MHGSRRGARRIEHLGSAHDDQEWEALKAAARQRLAGGQGELELGLDPMRRARWPARGRCRSRRRRWVTCGRGLGAAYDALAFDVAAGGDEVFRQLVLARIIEPTSKADSLRVLAEVGVAAASYPTLNRRLPGYATETRQGLAAASPPMRRWARPRWPCSTCRPCTSRPTPGDGFRERGFSKERRLEPQITIGRLTDVAGFPMMVRRSRAIGPRRPRCSRRSARSWPPTSSRT